MSGPSAGDYIRNFRASPEPFPTKVRLLLRNSARRITRRRPCCGNHGEPGC